MNQRRYISLALLAAVFMLLAGCRSNPAIRKQRYFESGKRFSTEGKYREASIQFMNALKVDGDFSDAHYELAQVYEHMGQFWAASEELERAINAQPDNLSARLDLGNLLLASGRTDSASMQANAVLTAQVNNPGAHALLSAIASREGKNETALAEIKRAIALDPNRAAFHQNLALLLANAPETAPLAEAELKKAVQLDPDSSNARLLLASYFVRNGRLVEAEKAAWFAVSADPHSLAARADVAQIILKQGDWARAEQVLRQAAKDFASDEQGAGILANYYASTRRFNKAKTEFANQLADHPKNVTLQKGYVRVLLQTHDYDVASALLSQLSKISPRDPEVTAFNGVLLLHEGKTDEAENVLQNSARSLPSNAFIQYWLGKAAEAKGESNLAEDSFRLASEFDPYSLDSREERARIASQRGDTALLEETAGRTISALPDHPEGYLWRAIVEMDRNSLDKCENDLRSALKVAPQFWQAYLQFGKLRFTQKRFPEGVALLEQALDYNPASVQALRLLTDYDIFQGHPELALAGVNAQILKSPQNSYFYDLLAQLQIQNNQLDKAAKTAQRAIQLNPSDGEAVSLFTQISVSRGMTLQAIDAWLRWSNDHPADAGALAVLGALEESNGSPEAAESYYKKSLQIQPRQPIAANNLAYRMLENDETPDVAFTLAETARQAMPDSPNTADTLAWAYYRRGTYQFARDLLENALNIDPGCAAMHYHLGMVYTKLNDKHNAKFHLKKALLLAHDPQTTKDAKTALQGLG